jgi:MYXO-CTERM domain-containing protein
VGADYKTLATGTRARNTGVHTWLLDMHPTAGQAANQQFRDAGFKVGETFTDPAGGLSITVSAMDATKATVHVEVANGTGGPVCLDGTPYVASTTMCGAPTSGTGDAGGGGIIVPPPPDGGGVTPGTGGAQVDAGREAGRPPTPEAGAGGATGTGGATSGTGGGGGGAGGGTVVADAAPTGSAGDIGAGGTGSPGTAGNNGGGQAGSNPLNPGNPPGPVQGGCSCRVGANSASRSGNDVAGGLALLLGLAGTRMRRRRTSSSARA